MPSIALASSAKVWHTRLAISISIIIILYNLCFSLGQWVIITKYVGAGIRDSSIQINLLSCGHAAIKLLQTHDVYKYLHTYVYIVNTDFVLMNLLPA